MEQTSLSASQSPPPAPDEQKPSPLDSNRRTKWAKCAERQVGDVYKLARSFFSSDNACPPSGLATFTSSNKLCPAGELTASQEDLVVTFPFYRLCEVDKLYSQEMWENGNPPCSGGGDAMMLPPSLGLSPLQASQVTESEGVS